MTRRVECKLVTNLHLHRSVHKIIYEDICMIKKYIGITLVTASMLVMGCSSNDDGPSEGTTTDGTTTDGTTTDGTTTDGTTTDGTTTDGTTTDGTTTDGTTTDGTTTDGTTTDGTTTDGTTTDGTTTDGTTTDGTTTDGTTTSGGTDFGNSVMGIVAAQPDLTKLEAAVLAAEGGLDQTLNDPNNTWTLFAPNDTALGDAVPGRDALLVHIHAGNQNAASLTGLVGSTLSMTGGAPQPITMAADGVTLQIGGVNIVQSDIVGDNGIVHKLDGVLQ